MAGAPVPAGIVAAWIEGAGGVRLRTALLPAKGAARGSVVVSTGRTESLEKYFETAQELSARGFAVLLHDWRGQGLSGRLLDDPLRGHAESFDDFLADFDVLLSTYQDRLPRPWIMLSHSMGGALGLTALARGETRFSAAVLLAPMLGINMSRINRAASGPLSRLFHAFGRGGDYVMGQKTSPWQAFAVNRLTHDPVRYKRIYDQLEAEPQLNLGGPTWGWLNSALGAMAWLRRAPEVGRIEIPVTVLSAAADRIVDNIAQAAVAARLPHGKRVSVDGAFHEILQETDERRAVFWREFDALSDVVAPAPKSANPRESGEPEAASKKPKKPVPPLSRG